MSRADASHSALLTSITDFYSPYDHRYSPRLDWCDCCSSRSRAYEHDVRPPVTVDPRVDRSRCLNGTHTELGQTRSYSTSTTVIDDETCFGALKAGLDLAAPGEKVFLNSGQYYYYYRIFRVYMIYFELADFYGHGDNGPTANLKLLQRFFSKYPEYADRAYLSVKVNFIVLSINMFLWITQIIMSTLLLQGAINLERFAPDCSPESIRQR